MNISIFFTIVNNYSYNLTNYNSHPQFALIPIDVKWLENIYTELNASHSILSGVILTLLFGFIIWLFKKYLFYRLEDKTEENLTQSFICLEPKLLSCHLDELVISAIPDLLLAYQRTLMHIGKNDEVKLWDTRISTYLAITDGNKILLYDRKKATQNSKQVINDNFDCHGAKKFHNDSLKFKLCHSIRSARVKALVPIPGMAVEKNEQKYEYWPFSLFNRTEVAVMIGYICLVSPEDLNKGKDDKNIIIDIDSVFVDNFNLTSKSKLALRYIKLNIDNIQKMNEKVELNNSFCYRLKNRLSLDMDFFIK